MTSDAILDTLCSWLNENGYRSKTNVDSHLDGVILDAVAKKDYGIVTFTVYKKSRDFDRRVRMGRLFSVYSYIVITTEVVPEDLEKYIKLGIGIISILNSTVKIIVEAARLKANNLTGWHKYAVEMQLDGYNLKKCKRRFLINKKLMTKIIMDYLRKHPDAKWAELYRNIPNPCTSINSFSRWLHLSLSTLLRSIEKEDKRK